jgi:pimeloyl-ACP methyl ester carboxylesterase
MRTILVSFLRAAALAGVGSAMLTVASAATTHAPTAEAVTAAPASADTASTHYRVARVDGIDIFYREAGPVDAPVVLLLHGFPASSFMYRDLIPKLAARYRVIAPDYPGFGYSAAPPFKEFDYTFERLADVIEKLTDQLGLDRYAIYAQDFGAPVGYRLATRRPAKVLALIAQNGNAYDEGLPEKFWSLARSLWKDPSPANYARIRDASMSDAALEWNYTHGVKEASRISPDSWVLQQALVNRPGNKEIMLALLYDYRTNLALYAQWHEYFRRHQPPMLIVWGRNDVVFPPSGAHAYLRDLPKAELHLLDTGHFALEEKGTDIAQLMLDFLGRTMARRAPKEGTSG